jgi:Na+/alanine symporter
VELPEVASRLHYGHPQHQLPPVQAKAMRFHESKQSLSAEYRIQKFASSAPWPLFAYSTLVGWSYNGEKALEYLAGSSRFTNAYRFVWVIAAFAGAVTSLDLVWDIADVFNGAMAIPNLIALVGLASVVSRETKEYLGKR